MTRHPINTCHTYRQYKDLCRRMGKQPTCSGFVDYCTAAAIPMSTDLVYMEGYRRALVDLENWFKGALPCFKSDRKRNNVQNVIWLLDCIASHADLLADYGDALPVEQRLEGKKVVYTVTQDWPLGKNISSDFRIDFLWIRKTHA